MLEMLAIYGHGRPLLNTVAENLFLLRQVTQPLCYEKTKQASDCIYSVSSLFSDLILTQLEPTGFAAK